MAYYKSSGGKHFDRKVVNVLYKMFKENTGRSMCDSGDAYGRNWEKNQGKKVSDFLKEPEVHIDFSREEGGKASLDYTVNLFHYLASCLDLDDTCEYFNREYVPAEDWNSEKAYGLSDAGEEYLISIGADIKEGWNSYNGEDPFSQVTQGSYVNLNGKTYLLLQIHGGCDVRGGYTDARLFLISEYEDGFLYPPDIWAECKGKSFQAPCPERLMECDEFYQDHGYGETEAEIDLGEDEDFPAYKAGFDMCN